MIPRPAGLVPIVVASGIGLSALAGCQADAASEEAWEVFRLEVTEACSAAADPLIVDPEIAVDPFGSEHYGMALLRGPARGAEDFVIQTICVYDKEAKTAEIGGELPPFEQSGEQSGN